MPSKPIILVLDDDEQFLVALNSRIHKHFGDRVRILTATDIKRADTLLEQHGQSVAIFVTDVMMPNGKPEGIELASRYAPTTSIIVISAFPIEEFGHDPETLGVAAFFEKSSKPTFFAALMAAIEEELASRQQPSIALSKERGTVLCTRFRLPDIAASQVPQIDLRDTDFQAIAHGSREWQSSIEAAGGRISAIHGQSLHAGFLDQSEPPNSFHRAVDSFMNTCDRMSLLHKDGFDRCPFGTALVTGLISSGLFGLRPPGIPAIVGRLSDHAAQIAATARSRELAVLPRSLRQQNLRLLTRTLGPEIRTELVQLDNVLDLVEVRYFRWKPRE